MTIGNRHLHRWLEEAVRSFLQTLPPGVAAFRIHPDSPPTAFEADIIPVAAGAAPITVFAEEASLAAMIAFGLECQADVRFYPKVAHAEDNFKREVQSICSAIALTSWQEQVVLRGQEVVSAEALFPPPIGRVRICGYKPFSFRFLKRRTEKVIIWEPYWRQVDSAEPL